MNDMPLLVVVIQTKTEAWQQPKTCMSAEPDQLDWGHYAGFSKKLNLKF